MPRSRKPRILIYGINFAPEPIGVGRYTADLANYLASTGISVDIVTSVPHYPGWQLRDGYHNWFKIEFANEVRIARCPLILRKAMRGIWRLAAPATFAISSAPIVFWRIIWSRPDTVLCVEPTLFCAPVALFAAKLVGARTVLHVQDLEVDAAFAVGHLKAGIWQRLANFVESVILRSFDAVVTISNHMAAALKTTRG